ncbi:MAG: hypothetical protein ACD_28C00291G0005 [uncultured bacterium]|nr:MAG: hypothetical protein ACD_28C00291G0005 [uncultured bacterium]
MEPDYKPPSSFWHTLLNTTLVLKGLNGIFEIVQGVALFFLSPEERTQWIQFLLGQELVEDPKDVLGNFLVELSQNLSLNSQFFIAFYLLIHGVINLIIVGSVWSHKEKAYRLAVFLTGAFILYQVFRLFHHFSFVLMLFILFDVFVLRLMMMDHKRRFKVVEV